LRQPPDNSGIAVPSLQKTFCCHGSLEKDDEAVHFLMRAI